jgi:Lon protease-like protein
MPLFPLGLVLYPGVMLPLHIFEDRYRQLVRDLLDMQDGTRLFGVVAIKAGREVGSEGITALHEIGCTAELRYAEAYEDGRFDIIVTGMQRFRLLEVEAAEPMQAVLEILPDPQSERSASLAARVGRLFVSYREALLAAQGVQDEGLNEVPELPDEPGELAYLVAASMILDMTDKQQLLEAASVDDRLRLLVTLLKREAAMVTGLSMRPAVELPQMPYASN